MAERWKWMNGSLATEADKEINSRSAARDWHRAMLSQGLDNDGKPRKAGLSPLGIGAYTPTGNSGKETLTGATGASITGGGVRSITINVAKFQDKTEIHTATLKEGVHEVEELIRDMFLRITNSAASAIH